MSSMVNDTPANLWLMDRPDLIATFTKIELWRLTQYQRVVYIDCDVVALRAPDELLSLEADFAAAPDVGWPDCFNSGMMVLRPNLQDYYALKALAQRGISFDGADQGLLNMHFRDWHRLSFTYNCTPSANYQYIPAYKHFQSTISLIHFIGAQKPWNMPRQIVPLDSPYNQLLGRWWSVYDRHYRLAFVSDMPEIVKTWTNILRYRPRQLRLKRRRLLKAIKPMPLVLTTSLVMTLLVMKQPPIMKHSRHLNGRPTMLKNPRTSTRNHTKNRNCPTNILLPPM